jgi:hypothetical protein
VPDEDVEERVQQQDAVLQTKPDAASLHYLRPARC